MIMEYYTLQDCSILLCHGPRDIYYPSPYVDMYGESHHNSTFRGKPLHLDARRYESLRRLWSLHQIPREIATKRANATRIIMNGYY